MQENKRTVSKIQRNEQALQGEKRGNVLVTLAHEVVSKCQSGIKSACIDPI